MYKNRLKELREYQFTQVEVANILNIERGVYSLYETEYIIIPIEGVLKNNINQEIICERGELLFGKEIYNDDNSSIDYDIKCSENSIIIKIKTIEILNYLNCSFKESVEKSAALQQLKQVKLFRNLPLKKLEDTFVKIKVEKYNKDFI